MVTVTQSVVLRMNDIIGDSKKINIMERMRLVFAAMGKIRIV